jgi:hypothetical protein
MSRIEPFAEMLKEVKAAKSRKRQGD